MNRAYGLIDVKSVDEDQRIITGVASSISTDRLGDVVEPKGAKFSLPMPLLWQHNSALPVGWVEFAKQGAEQITFRARLAKLADPGPLKDAVETAWQAVKSQLVRGVSIGFKALESSFLKDSNGVHFTEWEWLELSLVTIPANQDATIQTIRSVDQEQMGSGRLGKISTDAQTLAVSRNEPSASPSPGVTGKTLPKPKEIRAMTLAEQVAAFEAKRAAKAARMEELMTKAADSGTTLEEAESEEYDTAKDAIDEIDKHLVRLHDLEKVNIAKAVPVNGVKSVETGSQVRGGHSIISVKPNVPQGTGFVRYVRALVLARGNYFHAADIAKEWHDQTPEVELALRAAVATGTTTDATWAGPLVYAQNLSSEFIDFLRPLTIIGRIPGLRRVPFNIRIPRQTGASTVGWVGESAPKPVSALAFDAITMRWAKVAGIVVVSQELARFSNPQAEAVIRQDLSDTITQFTDHEFLDPDKSEVTNVSPAGVTNGVTPLAPSGTTAAALRNDLTRLMALFIASNSGIGSAVWIMSQTLAMFIMSMRNALDQVEFPDITAQGGTLMGLPVITSENMSTGMIVLLKANDILLADDGGVTIDVSTEGSVQMDSAPTNPPVAATVMRSFWQNNEVGIRAERFINWAKRRSGAVQFIANASYGGAPGGSGT